MSQAELIQTLNQEARSGDTVIAAAGGPPGDLLKIWDATQGRRCHLEFGFSCMGYEIPAGLGVRLTQETGEVYVLIGDGTYLMNPTELMTALQENLKITVVISENHGYQCIRRLQMWRTGVSFGNEFRQRDPQTKRLEGEYVALDIAKNAASFGARTWHVQTTEQLREALAQTRWNVVRASSSWKPKSIAICLAAESGGTLRRPKSVKNRSRRSCVQSTSAIVPSCNVFTINESL